MVEPHVSDGNQFDDSRKIESDTTEGDDLYSTEKNEPDVSEDNDPDVTE